MITKQKKKIIETAVEVEAMTALDANEIGFMARAMAQCTMPHSKPKEQEFTRKNGDYTLSMVALKAIGLPYGTIPRLILAWVSTEIANQKEPSRTIKLGDSLADFLEELGLSQRGGERGDITRLKDQLKRLFSCTISCNYETKKETAEMGFRIADKYHLWWEPNNENQLNLWESTITLSEQFYQEIKTSPIPIDMRVLKSLRKSPLALDVYVWLTYRMSYVKRPAQITWDQLQKQFGSEYKLKRSFKAAFIDAFRKVSIVYPGANVEIGNNHITLLEGETSVPLKRKTLPKK